MFQQLYYDFTVTEILSADVRGLGCKGHSNRPQYHASTAILWLHCEANHDRNNLQCNNIIQKDDLKQFYVCQLNQPDGLTNVSYVNSKS